MSFGCVFLVSFLASLSMCSPRSLPGASGRGGAAVGLKWWCVGCIVYIYRNMHIYLLNKLQNKRLNLMVLQWLNKHSPLNHMDPELPIAKTRIAEA